MFKSILVASDGSEDSQQALQYAAKLAQLHAATSVGIVHVIPDPSTYVDGYAAIDAAYWDHFYTELRSTGERLLTTAQEAIATTWSGPIRTHLQEGHIVHKIVGVIEENDYDLLIVGRRGLGRFERFLLGSVSGKLIAHAHIPVLVV